MRAVSSLSKVSAGVNADVRYGSLLKQMYLESQKKKNRYWQQKLELGIKTCGVNPAFQSSLAHTHIQFFILFSTSKSISPQANHVTSANNLLRSCMSLLLSAVISVCHQIHPSSGFIRCSCRTGPSGELITFIKVLSQAV